MLADVSTRPPTHAGDDEGSKLSKKQRKALSRLKIAELKQVRRMKRNRPCGCEARACEARHCCRCLSTSNKEMHACVRCSIVGWEGMALRSAGIELNRTAPAAAAPPQHCN